MDSSVLDPVFVLVSSSLLTSILLKLVNITVRLGESNIFVESDSDGASIFGLIERATLATF